MQLAIISPVRNKILVRKKAIGLLLGGVTRIPGHERILWPLARRFLGGKTVEEAMSLVRALNTFGFSVIIDQVGERSFERAEIERTRRAYENIAVRIDKDKLKAEISLKPSQFGLIMPRSFSSFTWKEKFPDLANLLASSPRNLRLWFDAEELEMRRNTWNLIAEVYPGRAFLGVALQAYADGDLNSTRFFSRAVRFIAEEKRSPGSVLGLRICKGAYDEAHALKNPEAIRNRFVHLAKLCFEFLSENRSSPRIFPEFATHDSWVIDRVRELASFYGLSADFYRYAFLLGRQETLASHLAAGGENVAIYMPFGVKWFPYFSRRIYEKPENLFLPFLREGVYHSCQEPKSCRL